MPPSTGRITPVTQAPARVRVPLAPGSVNTSTPTRLRQLAVVTAVLFFGLRALGNALQVWDRDPVELWVTVANLNFIAATAITHVAVFHPWPVPLARSV